MEFLLLHHPIDCPVCDQSGECWLQDYYMEHAGHEPISLERKRPGGSRPYHLGPLVKLDRERCILCTRCVRFTRNVTKTGEIGVFNRGHAAEIAIHGEQALRQSVLRQRRRYLSGWRAHQLRLSLQGPGLVSQRNRLCLRRAAARAATCASIIRRAPWAAAYPAITATEGTIYRTVGRRNVAVNKSWLCDEGRLSFHTLERWPRLRDQRRDGAVDELLSNAISDSRSIRKEHGADAVAALGSATNTNEALFLMKKYFQGSVDFRLGNESQTYQKQQDDLLRRFDKHPNTQGALDLGLAGKSEWLAGNRRTGRTQADSRECGLPFIRNSLETMPRRFLRKLEQLIRALEFSVVSTTHEFPWAAERHGPSADGGMGRREGNVHELRRTRADCEPCRCACRRIIAVARDDVANCWDSPAFRFPGSAQQSSNGWRAKHRRTPAWTTTRSGRWEAWLAKQ